MLPNWLYGKSKSKLAELLGGGGTPSDYNQVKAQVTQNTEDIANLDDAFDTKAALTQITNPNLLDNPWFTVNQRGESSYSFSGGSYNYTVDRWFNNYPNGVVTVGNGVTLNNYKWLCQSLNADIVDLLEGKTVTASVMLSNGTIISGTNVFHAGSTTIYVVISSDENAIIRTSNMYNMPAFEIVNFAPALGEDLTIRAVKLELGSVSTLAQDVAPNYAIELLKCQRYFVRVGATSRIYLGTAIALDNDKATAVIKLPTTMKTVPSVTGITNLELSNGSAIAITDLDSRDYNNGYLALTVSASGTTAGSCYFLRVKADTNIDFSADL